MSKLYGRCDYCQDEMDWPPVRVPNTCGELRFCDLDHAVRYFDDGPDGGEEE